MKEAEIRNFCIISHINHGKSTLADRFLELTGAVKGNKMRPQFLDMMDLERERGITIRMQPVKMRYNLNFKSYDLNLIDTPGHVDFSYEVSRSLAAVEGAILLVDASQGVQAQTLANLELAQKQNLTIIPAVNKIDLEQSKVEESVGELANLLKVNQEDILRISAKTGKNVPQLLEAVITRIPPPRQNRDMPFRALIFDSEYDLYKGIIAYVRVVEGEIKNGQKILFFAAQVEAEIKEIGYFKPEPVPAETLSAGEIGYIATGIKDPGKVRVGDTIMKAGLKLKPLPGYREPAPMIFASLYPEDSDDFDLLKTALLKLKLNDPSLTFESETKEALGRGFRCGFLGALHVEIVSERLRREFGLELIISTPSVVYKIMPPQQFAVAVQAAVGGDIIARETLKARRKDVTAPLYGGDYSRKRKLLEKQKKGKKKLKEKGAVRIPPEVFLSVFKE